MKLVQFDQYTVNSCFDQKPFVASIPVVPSFSFLQDATLFHLWDPGLRMFCMRAFAIEKKLYPFPTSCDYKDARFAEERVKPGYRLVFSTLDLCGKSYEQQVRIVEQWAKTCPDYSFEIAHPRLGMLIAVLCYAEKAANSLMWLRTNQVISGRRLYATPNMDLNMHDTCFIGCPDEERSQTVGALVQITPR